MRVDYCNCSASLWSDLIWTIIRLICLSRTAPQFGWCVGMIHTTLWTCCTLYPTGNHMHTMSHRIMAQLSESSPNNTDNVCVAHCGRRSHAFVRLMDSQCSRDGYVIIGAPAVIDERVEWIWGGGGNPSFHYTIYKYIRMLKFVCTASSSAFGMAHYVCANLCAWWQNCETCGCGRRRRSERH